MEFIIHAYNFRNFSMETTQVSTAGGIIGIEV